MHTEVENNGKVTAYGFACGRYEERERGNTYAKLYKEGTVYHVQVFTIEPWVRTAWESTYVLSDARRLFAKAFKK